MLLKTATAYPQKSASMYLHYKYSYLIKFSWPESFISRIRFTAHIVTIIGQYTYYIQFLLLEVA
jgi:hypothetical protein